MSIEYVIEACRKNDIFVTKFLVEMFDLDVNQKINNETPLSIATQIESIDLVYYLLKKGAWIEDFMIESAIEKGNFLLFFAFIFHGYEINANQGRLGILACQKGNFDMIQHLIGRGYDLDEYGSECLFWSLDKKNFDISDLLFSKGVYIDQKDELLLLNHDFPHWNSLYLELIHYIVTKHPIENFVLSLGVDRSDNSILLTHTSLHGKNLRIFNYSVFSHRKRNDEYETLYITGQGDFFLQIKDLFTQKL